MPCRWTMIHVYQRQCCAVGAFEKGLPGLHPHAGAVTRDQKSRDVLLGHGAAEDESIAIHRQQEAWELQRQRGALAHWCVAGQSK